MLFFKTAIAALTAAALVSAMPPRWSSFDAEMCHGFREPCDRAEGQCCPWLQCNLGRYECEPRDAHKNEMCHFVGEPCDRAEGQCCPGLKCNLNNYACEWPRAHNKLFQSNEMCHNIREPCDRQDQCCPGLKCNLDRYECEPRRAHNEMCTPSGLPCGAFGPCCSFCDGGECA
ncbi:hypothetical protein BG005_001328 [Podila minutissima]|nr:hypothetical protein BG005_001328 [Podila minutissima]